MNKALLAVLTLGLGVGLLTIGACSDRKKKETTELMEVKKDPFTLKVYLENSGSLWGYVNGTHREYGNFLHDLISSATSSKLVKDSAQLFFINTVVTPVPGDAVTHIDHLKKEQFSAPTSQMIDMLGMIVDAHQPGDVSVFVSDCIFTSGSSLTTENLSTGIKDKMMAFKNKGENSVLVYALPASFNGKYYSPKLGGQKYDGERPLYVWMLGDTKALARIVHELNVEKLNGVQQNGFQEFAAVQTNNELSFSVDKSLKGLGSYGLVKGDKHAIKKARPADGRRAGFELPLVVNLSALPFSDAFLQDVSNYTTSSEAFEVARVEPTSNGLYKLTLCLANPNAPGVPKGKVTISVKRPSCSWIDVVSDTDGGAPVEGRTFGVQHMLNGLQSAYEQGNADVAKFTLDIQ